MSCVRCRAPIARARTGRPRRYCSDSCRTIAYRHRQKRSARDARNDWWTPSDLRARILSEYVVTLDAAASEASALVLQWLGPTHPDEARRDALSVEWGPLAGDGVVWCNPPYGRGLLSQFMVKIREEAEQGVQIIALVPASVGTRWWHECVTDIAEIEFCAGRLRFEGPHSTGGPAAFDSALLVYGEFRKPTVVYETRHDAGAAVRLSVA